ncbi:MAG: hypothetical protein ACOYMF_18320 [Bacteroidales bacterium]
MSVILISNIAGRVPTVNQLLLTDTGLGYNRVDALFYGIKITGGVKTVVCLGESLSPGVGESHERLHAINSALDHAVAVEADRDKLVATNPVTGEIELISKTSFLSLWEAYGDTVQPKENRGIDFARDTPCIVVFSNNSNATESESFDGHGVVGRSTNLDGINGTSIWGAGVRGSSENDYGVRGNSSRIGDDTDNVTIDTTGTIKLNGKATVFDDLTVSGMQTKKTGSNQPDFKQVAGGIYIDTFPPNSFAEVFFSVQLPHSYKEGSDVSAHVHWMPMSSVMSSQDVIWKLEYEWRNINDIFSGASTTVLTATAPSGTPGYKHLLSEFPDISGTGKTISSIIICRLYRDATNALDTYTADAGFLAIDFHIEKDTLGSNSEYTK